MSTTEWRDVVVQTTATFIRDAGVRRFDYTDAKRFLKQLASKDRKRPRHARVGYAYVLDTYSESGMSRFLKTVENAWSSPVPDPVQSTPSDPGSAHQYECVIAVQLNADTYTPGDIHRTLQDFLVNALTEPFGCAIVQVVKVHACWYDMKIRYSANLCDIFGLLLSPDWVVDAVTKPSSEYGKFTLVNA